MRIDRFYVNPALHNKYGAIVLKHDFWLNDVRIINQWRKVLRYREGQKVILFDGVGVDRLYQITELYDDEAHVELVTEYVRVVPKRIVYLFFSILKKDKNEWLLQKCTEIGVSHFIPIISEFTEKGVIDEERATKILIESSEQCGRSNIPSIREPLLLQTALHEFIHKIPILIADKSETTDISHEDSAIGVVVGPEGGWSETERQLFNELKLDFLHLGDFTLRAETASISASTKLLQ
ncbi:MAG: 16S rRNA (uracil(1498)-N(3))-methyltransferase [Candidatus Saccharimonadales bacterium]